MFGENRTCRRGCDEDATRKLLPWNLGLTELHVCSYSADVGCVLAIKLKFHGTILRVASA